MQHIPALQKGLHYVQWSRMSELGMPGAMPDLLTPFATWRSMKDLQEFQCKKLSKYLAGKFVISPEGIPVGQLNSTVICQAQVLGLYAPQANMASGQERALKEVPGTI